MAAAAPAFEFAAAVIEMPFQLRHADFAALTGHLSPMFTRRWRLRLQLGGAEIAQIEFVFQIAK